MVSTLRDASRRELPSHFVDAMAGHIEEIAESITPRENDAKKGAVCSGN